MVQETGGRTLRLQVAIDITEREHVSQRISERLEFARRISDYANLLSRQKDWREVVSAALSAMGEFYKADRAYLFEEHPGRDGCWSNAFEWCAVGSSHQRDNLQQVPPEAVERWMEAFRTGDSIILYNLEPLRKKFPLEWEILDSQDIQRVIAVPLMLPSLVRAVSPFFISPFKLRLFTRTVSLFVEEPFNLNLGYGCRVGGEGKAMRDAPH